VNRAEAVRNLQPSKAFAPPFFEGLLGLPPYIQGKKGSGFDERNIPPSPFLTSLFQPPSSALPQMQNKMIGGVNHYFADRPIMEGNPPSPLEYRIRDGRYKPAEHCIANLSVGSEHGLAAEQLSPVAIPLSASCYARTIDASDVVFMFAPRSGGVVVPGGVYFGLRQVYGPHGSGLAIDYTVPFLPRGFSVLEIGKYIDGARTASHRRILPTTSATMRGGLARENVYEPGTTRFCLTACGTYYSLCSLAFDFEPADEDATIIGWAHNRGGGFQFNIVSIGRGLPGLAPLAFWMKIPNRAEISDIAFFGGACAYPAWQGSVVVGQVGPSTIALYPKRAEWGTWVESKYPYTLRGCADGLRPDGVVIESVGADQQPKTPIYAEFDPNPTLNFDLSREIYPVREVQAKCAELETSPRWSHFDPKTAFLYDHCDDFIFDGKKITGLNVEFSPYLAATTNVPTGEFTPLTQPSGEPPAIRPDQVFDRFMDDGFFSTDRRALDGRYWKANGQVSVPAGEGNVGFVLNPFTGAPKETEYFYSGVLSLIVETTDGGPIAASLPAGPVAAEVEQAAILSLERSGLNVPAEPDSDPASGYKTSPSSIAPPTGSYELETFSMASIASAPGVFRYVGSGQFSANQTFTFNRVVLYGGPTEWEFDLVVDGSNRYKVLYESSRATIATTLEVSLNTDHVEIYSVFGSRLQEAGNYETDNVETQELEPPPLDVWDQPRGRLRDQSIYVEGLEPHALLTLTMFVRTAMRCEAIASADYSAVPGYGGSFATPGEMQPYSTSVVGMRETAQPNTFQAGPGNLENNTVFGADHSYLRIDYTFTRSQTLAILDGEPVELTAWQTGGAGPLLADLGVQFFQYKMVVTATVEDV